MRTNLEGNKNLRSKFQEVEDATKNELKYSISEESFQKLSSETKAKIEIPNNRENLVRIQKILSAYTKDVFQFLEHEFINPTKLKIKNSIRYCLTLIKKSRGQGEIKIKEYLDEFEWKINEKKKLEAVEEGIQDQIKISEKNISKLFPEIICNSSIDTNVIDFKNAEKSLEFISQQLRNIYTKLNEGKLLQNVQILTLNTTIEKERITQELEFELLSSGVLWSTIFCKYISPLLLDDLKRFEGNVEGYHQNNLTRNKETFILIFSFKKLEVFSNIESMNELENRLNKIEKLVDV